MYRFFVEPAQIGDEMIMITGDDVNHLKNVLRMRIGEQITISDQQENDYICEIAQMDSDCVMARILFKEEMGRELDGKLYLFQGLPKGDKMELIIQKAVELGAGGIIPVATKRCVVKLDEKKAQSKVSRWNAIANSAAKQSKRGFIPEVFPVVSFSDSLKQAREMGLDILLIPYELADGMETLKQVTQRLKPGMKIGIMIGPEGGFEENEVEAAIMEGAVKISLGRRILRTETAGMAILAYLMLQMEMN